jgi:hypothetical protein
MSIQVSIKATGLNISAYLKDESLGELIQLVQKNRDESPPAATSDAGGTGGYASPLSTEPRNEEEIKEWLRTRGAAELLNLVKWDTYPEKILLLSAWHESRGGDTPWKSADMDEVFRQAKEKPPNNFPRDIKTAIKSGVVHAETPRAYTVTRTGWNKIGQTIEQLGR